MTLAASTCGLLRTGASSRQYPTGRQGAVFFRSLGFSRSRSDARCTPVLVPGGRASLAGIGVGGPGRRIRTHAHPPAARELARVRVAVAAFSSSSDLPYHLVVGMPALSPTMESGTLSEWKVEEGGSFGAGDSLAEIQTDKASIDFEAQDDGFVARHLVPPGTEAAVGQPIMVTVEEEEYVAAFKDFVVPPAAAVADGGGESATAGATAPPPSVASPPAADEPLPPSAASASGSASLLFPSARHMAESRNLDATVLRGSGKGGRVTKGDVLAAIAGGATLPPLLPDAAGVSADASMQQRAAAAPAPAPAAAAPSIVVSVPDASPSGSYEDVPNNNMRKVIARRLTESKRDVPHFYTSADIELDAVLNLRKHLASNHDVKVSVNDFILKSSAMALRDVPEINASYDVKTGSVGMNPDVDISVAVATPTGLITPIVKSVDRIGLADVTARVRDLATRARDGKLLPEEYQGGSFTVSNLGMFGVDEFSAVINPPQCAILAVGGGSRRIVPTPYVEDEDGEWAERVVARPGIRTVMTARLSSDRRVVDEPTASLFMQALTHYLSTPNLLLL